ncbi:MAG: hypothetical protein CO141_00835 [Candidatus Moranbacteria bacterium CG_4_9_14_3_um_filter_42_9]|nr:MAG: hypothetical protein CO141_00835 [Candidatus Moranbacteria bacterium CG_4_9_14_3_um_filter_42_9]
MAMQNKFEKVLISLSSFLVGIILILGIKIEDTNKKLASIKNDLESGALDNNLDNQDMVSATREKILNEVANSPVSDVNQKVTTQTVIPGKMVKEVVPVTTKVSSSSSKSSSSSSKTTKSS